MKLFIIAICILFVLIAVDAQIINPGPSGPKSGGPIPLPTTTSGGKGGKDGGKGGNDGDNGGVCTGGITGLLGSLIPTLLCLVIAVLATVICLVFSLLRKYTFSIQYICYFSANEFC